MHKYYKIVLNNIYLKNGKSELVFGVLENGKLYEILTNKEIYMIYDENLSYKDDFLEQNSRLIGIAKEEVGGEDVSLFLRFTTKIGKERIIKRIKDMEKSINDCLNDKNTDNFKIKQMKKSDFLKKY
ncbi:MAG: hypothetical protein IJ068_04205 [Bacilli bacterium]|nr:hypothetical protein [Bacilli bacterium]